MKDDVFLERRAKLKDVGLEVEQSCRTVQEVSPDIAATNSAVYVLYLQYSESGRIKCQTLHACFTLYIFCIESII